MTERYRLNGWRREGDRWCGALSESHASLVSLLSALAAHRGRVWAALTITGPVVEAPEQLACPFGHRKKGRTP